MRVGVSYSVHAGDELVDKLLTVAPDATLLEGVSLLGETLKWAGKFEGPQEVVGFLEVGSDGPDLVDKVLNAADSLFSEVLVNDGIVIERNSGSVHLAVASLVDESADGVTGGVSVGDVRLNKSDHVDGGAVQLHKHTVVELSESQELHDLLLLGSQLVDTNHQNTHTGLVNLLIYSGCVFLTLQINQMKAESRKKRGETYPLVRMTKAILACSST